MLPALAFTSVMRAVCEDSSAAFRMFAVIAMPDSEIDGCCTSASATAVPVAVTLIAPESVTAPLIASAMMLPITDASAMVRTLAVALFVFPERREALTLPADWVVAASAFAVYLLVMVREAALMSAPVASR